jgi:signal transduction histidine kinase/CheY-like chemotaxis protein
VDHEERRRPSVLAAFVPLIPLAVATLALAVLAFPATTEGRFLTGFVLLAGLGGSILLQRAREHARERRPAPGPELDLPAQRARAELLAAVGHELRTPLGAILGMTDLAGQTPLTPEQREYVDGAQRAARHLQGLVDDLLSLSQLDDGTLPLEEVAFSLPSLVGDTARAFLPPARSQGLELVCEIAPDTPDGVRGDPARLRQILTLLLDNALKFTSEGRVTVAVGPTGEGEATGRLALSVSDTGVGIAPADQERIFEPLTQVDASTTRRAGGAGLGLALVARLVRLMGGEVRLESEPGRGSTFRVEVDLPEDPAGRGPTETDLEMLQGQRVLVLDGEPASRQVLAEILETLGVRARLTDDPSVAHDALAHAVAEGSPFAVMIVDPRVRGSILFRAQRAEDDPLVAATPRILLEAPGERAWGGRTGGSPRLARPVTRPELVAALQRALAEPPSPAPIPSGETGADSLRVLVAEDNALNAFMATRMLERLGHRAEVAGDGAQAVAAVERNEFDVILMDIQMPEMDGFEATRQIRAGERGTERRVRVVAVTAFGAWDERERYEAAGMDDLLAKPFTLEALAGILRPRPAEATPGDEERVTSPALPGVFDLERLATQLGGDEEAVAEVLAAFVRDAPATLAQLREATTGGDASTVEHAAHRLKGSLLWITAEAAATQAATLEDQARSGDREALGETFQALSREVERVLEEATRRTDTAPS